MFRHHVKAWLSFDRLQLDLVGDRGEVLLRRRVLLPVRVEVEAADVVLRTNHFDENCYKKAHYTYCFVLEEMEPGCTLNFASYILLLSCTI